MFCAPKIEESTLTDDSYIHIGNIIKEEMIDEEKVLEENSVEEGKMKECIIKEEKDELVQQCHRNSSLSSSANDCSSFIGSVITKEMIEEEKALEEKVIEEEIKIKERIAQEEKDKLEEHCYKRLNLLLSRSSIYAEFMADKIRRDREKEEKRQQRAEKAQKRKKDCKIVTRKKRSVLVPVHESNKDEDIEEENNCVIESKIETLSSKQPSLLTGAEMHPYQIKGFEWLKALYENGVNGILADEMGLGKTIQTIAFIAYLIEMGISGPFFVCGPLSTVPNWYNEFTRFTPNIPAVVYHGTKDERKLMRESFRKKVRKENVFCHPVVITSYQVALNDAKLLSHFNWKLLVVDEAHRIKNFQCKLVSALKLYNASNRLLLTGTPLQNDLSELWSLLNFILPEVFDDLKVFESWFDISRLTEKGGTDDIIAKEQEKQIVSIIHQILTPFLLRRTKTEVSLKLPPKKEVIVHAPLTKLQQEYYTAALNKTIGDTIGDQRGKYFHVDVDINSSRPKRHLNIDFDKIYKQLEDDTFENLPEPVKESVLTSPKSSAAEVFAEIKLNIRNICMVLRKICGHPYLISYPLNPETGGHKIDEDFVKNSGKLLVLDSMLPELKKRGHKVLIFSQFVSMLEILEDYCIYRKFSYTILCGDMSLTARQKEIDFFNNSENSFIFLISTKAGGLGINLAEADTVIIYDSDWNPQGDIQAQDRCHRIGQTKPVVIYRLMVPNSVDERIIDRANAKRKLEKVIIKKGRFNSQNSKTELKVSIEELLELLHSSDTDGFVKTDDNCVISPEELDRILDRSDMLACD